MSHPHSAVPDALWIGPILGALAVVLLSLGLVGAGEPPSGETPSGETSSLEPPSSVVPAPRSDEWAIAREKELLRRARESAPARIVNVSSAGQASIDFNDPMLEHRYDGLQAYGQSKLAQVMDTIELSAELDPEAVTVNCLHPATYMDTEMIRLAGVNPASTVGEGAEATLRLVTESSLDGTSGLYFDHAHESAAHSQAYDEDARTKLMVLSKRLTGA